MKSITTLAVAGLLAAAPFAASANEAVQPLTTTKSTQASVPALAGLGTAGTVAAVVAGIIVVGVIADSVNDDS